MSALFLGIDIGTSSVKAVIADSTGHIVSIGRESYELSITAGYNAEQNPEAWWIATVSAITHALEKLSPILWKNIEGIGLSGQMHGLVLLGKDGEPLYPAINWTDRRAIQEANDICAAFDDSYINHHLGGMIAPGFTAPLLLWMKKHEGALLSRADTFLLAKDYVRYRLTGIAATEQTDASGTGMFDIASRTWSKEVQAFLGLPPHIYPDVHTSCEITGGLSKTAADILGLPCGIPVSFGGGDQLMQALGNGIDNHGATSITIGSGGQVLMVSDSMIPMKDHCANTFVHAAPNTWAMLGGTLSAGLSLKWFYSTILESTDFQQADQLAANADAGSNGIVFLPYLLGDRTPHMDPLARGAFIGLSADHDRRHMIRSVMEGVCFSLRESLEYMEAQGLHSEKIAITGGGAYSTVWRQILADVLGRDLVFNMRGEQTGLGAALTAAVAVKAYPSLSDACACVSRGPSHTERPGDNAIIYNKLYEVFRCVYRQNKEIMHLLASYQR